MNYKDILGSCSDDEAKILEDCAREVPLNRFLEIGTFVGKSASILGQVAKDRDGTLICIDYFVENMKYWGNPEIIIPDTRKTFLQNMDMCGLMNNIIALRGNSTKILEDLNGKFGMIYIDGGHTIKSVLVDALLSKHHLVPGGILAFHDYENKNWEDVRIVVDCLCQKWGVEIYKQSESKNLVAIKF